ncbi:alkyl hydroperoxide reductase [Komagataeibacter rhaeticus]|mgnify:FL=1|uniref:Alkyl hydroperoxide reductase AhpD n=1 Tax=Komagataeibacter rhaeticus TaxID=215221 RepID=A0A181C708_9PROT|nr:carboxymuconolactone decarboxylase family protein [Komagataeibacter rhaeticus]ATU73778.1 alkyl hydroperoxide reductase [Komagataeibacter xylinus]EGG78331.1 Alkyl hydroperoxide reductase AhpD [Gluconacetobacter sp. SXCC-1]KDU94880.1 alkyl hydroperoxide reductase [Komagataeibacter rhaeticus AF1]MBL7239352.1 carboxymuconolactone decarboxylase family protein [Komagataeibacter rhaeticus]PYD55133.1 alkyl hydroperoxide reductase [Komagataeibacter rhaeticus]
MSIDSIKAALPDYAKDLKLNLSSLANDIVLTPQQLGGTFIACAIAARNPAVTHALTAEYGPRLAPAALEAARAAAAIMGMNNVYYRFVHLVGGDYAKLPARLRMNVISNPGVDKVDFELWAMAVSAINGCGLCMESHERQLRAAGLTTEHVQTAVRIAATVNAIAVTLEGVELPA